MVYKPQMKGVFNMTNYKYEGIIGYTKWIMRNIEHFYNIEPKTNDELEIY